MSLQKETWNVEKQSTRYALPVTEKMVKVEKYANAPRISGQHSWYIARQLKNFKNNVRGTHFNDITGMQMRPIAMTLGTDQDIDDVVAYVGSLNGRGKHSGVKGDIKKGKSAYAVCVTCHGANGQGNRGT